jgi:hypothetical protein
MYEQHNSFNASQDAGRNRRLQNTTMDSGFYSFDGDDHERSSFPHHMSSTPQQMNPSACPPFFVTTDVHPEPNPLLSSEATGEATLFDFSKYHTETSRQGCSDIEFDHTLEFNGIDLDILLVGGMSDK